MRRYHQERPSSLGMILLLVLAGGVLAGAGAIWWLGSNPTPPPAIAVEKVIPNERFKG